MTQTISRMGRLPKDADRPELYEGKLYKLLQEHLPEEYIAADGRIDTVKLSKKIENHRFTIYRWFGGGNMSPRAAKKLIELSEQIKGKKKGRITRELLSPFYGL